MLGFLRNFNLEKIGCPKPTTYHPSQPHDKIEVLLFNPICISRSSVDLYLSGQSLQAIASKLRCSKTAVRDALIKAGVELRAHSTGQLDARLRVKAKALRNAPYGYCLVNGQLEEDPREVAVVQLIMKWWRQGLSHGAIARQLNRQKIKPRKAAQWSQPTVGFIIKRQPN